MSPQNEEESARLLTQTLGRLPPAWVLLVTLIGGSGVFSGAWWLGLDTRPNPWTSIDAKRVNSRQDAEVFAIRADLEAAERALWEYKIHHAELAKRFYTIEASVHEHHENSRKWIERIESNTKIILDNQASRHKHNGHQ